jgi:carbonic anhydrase
MAKRLFEAMIEANHRALSGDTHAGLHPAEFEEELPLVALTCVDPRLNALLPQALGVQPEQFIWLRNAGNIITGPMSSTMRSLALACAVKGGKEIVILGHTDCQVGKTTTLELIDRLRALGVERHILPDNLNEFFGIFGSERQNVLKAVELVRSSPLIGSKIPVQGLLIDVATGNLEWLVNGYEKLGAVSAALNQAWPAAGPLASALAPLAGFKLGEMKFPEGKIGELAAAIGEGILEKIHPGTTSGSSAEGAAPSGSPLFGPAGFKLGEVRVPVTKVTEVVSAIGRQVLHPPGPGPTSSGPPPKLGQAAGSPPKIPMPPRLRPKMQLKRNPK